jgi:predicted O-methyltransferase YrrM
MINRINIKEKIKSLNVSLPPVETFWKMGDLTALRQDSSGRFYRANYERGLLLYALVAKFRPQVILEFGTGRGYGALCMARAMVENNIPGQIYSIDKRSYHDREPWILDEGKGGTVRPLSWQEVWPQHFPAEWLNRIKLLNGRSENVIREWSRKNYPSIDFAFIDAGHDYLSVKHDFYSVLENAQEKCGILFDDYVSKPGFGIQKLIDEEISPHHDVECVVTDRQWQGSEHEFSATQDYGMIWLDFLSTNKTWKDIFSYKKMS